jgi:signal transduction histidine kinase
VPAADVSDAILEYRQRMGLPRPQQWDVLIAVAAAAGLIVEGLLRGSGSAGAVIVLALLTALPLAGSSRAPLAALLSTTAGLLVCLAVFQPYDVATAVLAVALYRVASLGDRRRSLLVGAAAAALVVSIAVVVSDSVAANAAVRLGVIIGALVIGDTVRSRRELREARRERDQRIAQEREQESLRRLADERLRVARELHDTVAHALVAINVSAGVAAHLRRDDDVLTEIMAVSAQALEDLRTTLGLLRETDEPAPTGPVLDLTSLAQLVDRVTAAGVQTDTEVELNGTVLPLAVGQAGYRIVQEALTNVMRHAPASHARVVLHVAEDALLIDVTDDGVVDSEARSTGGHGLLGMTERAAALGGQLSAGPAEAGWHVHARLPLAPSGRT